MGALEELSEALARLAGQAGRSVVKIGGGWRSGAGVVIEPGYLLTNAHNIGRDQVAIEFADGRRAEAGVVGVDADGDLAVLAFDAADAPPIGWADRPPGVGAVVFAVAPNGGGARVTVGTVSSAAQAFRGPRGRLISGALEHTAPLAPGSSGSPLLDASGQLVGLNTNRLGGGFYLALPADSALRERVDALRRGEKVQRPRLGVALAPSSAARQLRRAVGLPERDGVLVRVVEAGSPAERASIREGDLIVEAGGTPMREPDDLYEALGRLHPGEALALRLVRGEEERTVEARFDEPSADSGGKQGDNQPPSGPSGPLH